jgi:hypothetical protein
VRRTAFCALYLTEKSFVTKQDDHRREPPPAASISPFEHLPNDQPAMPGNTAS